MNYPRKEKALKQPTSRKPCKQGALSIEERPESINKREEVGHYEIDLVILNQKKGMQLLTLTERKTRFEIIRIIPDKTSQASIMPWHYYNKNLFLSLVYNCG